MSKDSLHSVLKTMLIILAIVFLLGGIFLLCINGLWFKLSGAIACVLSVVIMIVCFLKFTKTPPQE